MTKQDSAKLDKILKSFEEFKRTQYDYNAKFNTELQVIHRGLYGDERNEHVGLIQRQKNDDNKFISIDDRLVKIEKKQFKIGVLLAVGASIIMVIVEFIKNLFK